MATTTISTRSNTNVFDDRMAALEQIDRVLMTDPTVIAQFICNRRKYILRSTEGTSLKGRNIGFMNVRNNHLQIVAVLVNIIKINNKQEINQKKYLDGLAVNNIDDIAVKLHAFTRKSTSSRNKPSIYLWEFKLYSLINPDIIIGVKSPDSISELSTLWNCKNKLIIKERNRPQRLKTSDIYYCYGKLIPTNKDLPVFNVCTSPFIIGRRSQTGSDNVNWPSHLRSTISGKHCTITHDFTKNITFIQVRGNINIDINIINLRNIICTK